MTQIEVWGNATWTLFHTLAEKVKEESFSVVGLEIFSLIYRISSFLPCPECSMHAKKFLSKTKPETLKTKEDLINLMYIFHNVANKNQKKELFNFENINIYKKKNLIQVYNTFINSYKTNGNMKLLTETFQRQLIVKNFKSWIIKNIKHFTP